MAILHHIANPETKFWIRNPDFVFQQIFRFWSRIGLHIQMAEIQKLMSFSFKLTPEWTDLKWFLTLKVKKKRTETKLAIFTEIWNKKMMNEDPRYESNNVME